MPEPTQASQNPPPTGVDSNKIVTANQRYGSVGLELGARIQSRQNTINTFVIVIFAFIGAFFKFAYDIGPQNFITWEENKYHSNSRADKFKDIKSDTEIISKNATILLKDKSPTIQEMSRIIIDSTKEIQEQANQQTENDIEKYNTNISSICDILINNKELLKTDNTKENIKLLNFIKEKTKSIEEKTKNSSESIKALLSYISVCIPIMGLVFSSWVGYQAVKIQHIHKYMAELESLGNLGLPTWHDTSNQAIQDSDGWFKKAEFWRNVNNAAFSLILLITCVPSAIVAYVNSKGHVLGNLGSGIVTVLIGTAFYLLSSKTSTRNRIILVFLTETIWLPLLYFIINSTQLQYIIGTSTVDILSTLSIIAALFGIILFFRMEYISTRFSHIISKTMKKNDPETA